MAVKNQQAVNRLYKIIGQREFTARSAVDALSVDGYRSIPHANALAYILKLDKRFVITKRTKEGMHFKKHV